MPEKSEGSISYERETPALAADTADGKHIPNMGAGTKNIEAGGAANLYSAESLAGQGTAESPVFSAVAESPAGKNATEKGKKEYSPEEHARNANSRTIFSNRELTCQFLRDYTDLPIFSDLRPEDIEDVTDRYKAFLGVEFEADTVKKVRVRVPEEECENRRETTFEGGNRREGNHEGEFPEGEPCEGEVRTVGMGESDTGTGEREVPKETSEVGNRRRRVCEREVFVIPLIEHKTRVDYDVAMQLLRYMAVIWYDYKKQQESLREGSSERKSFRYPPIIPIVYYEGKAPWTAGMRLADRIDLSSADELAGYIPDFTYKMVRLHKYGNEELKEKHNEMSLVMMINRIQSPEDYTEFLKTSREYVDEIYNGTTEDIRKVYREVLWTLFQKMNVPVEEAREKLAEMEEKGVGTLFADMEKMDIQEERRKTKQAREEADAAKKALEEFKLQTDKKLELSNRKLERSNQKLERSNQKLEQSNQKLEWSNQKLEQSNQALEQSHRELEELKRQSSAKMNAFFSQLVSLCQGEKMSQEETVTCLQERYKLNAEDAISAVEQFWSH